MDGTACEDALHTHIYTYIHPTYTNTCTHECPHRRDARERRGGDRAGGGGAGRGWEWQRGKGKGRARARLGDGRTYVVAEGGGQREHGDGNLLGLPVRLYRGHLQGERKRGRGGRVCVSECVALVCGCGCVGVVGKGGGVAS